MTGTHDRRAADDHEVAAARRVLPRRLDRGNPLAVDGTVTAVLDWEAAVVGDPLRELARVAWSAGRKDPDVAAAIVDAYGADPTVVRAWMPVRAAELWLWFREAGPPEYLAQLTTELERWPAD